MIITDNMRVMARMNATSARAKEERQAMMSYMDSMRQKARTQDMLHRMQREEQAISRYMSDMSSIDRSYSAFSNAVRRDIESIVVEYVNNGKSIRVFKSALTEKYKNHKGAICYGMSVFLFLNKAKLEFEQNPLHNPAMSDYFNY